MRLRYNKYHFVEKVVYTVNDFVRRYETEYGCVKGEDILTMVLKQHWRVNENIGDNLSTEKKKQIIKYKRLMEKNKKKMQSDEDDDG